MQPGAGRILTTHSGSLPRPSRFLSLVLAQEAGESVDEAQFADEVRAAVRETVRLQADAGVDVLNDGEMGKPSYATYVKDRLTGFGGLTGDESAPSPGLRTGVFEVDQVRETTLDVSGARPARDTSACPHDSGGPYFREGKDGSATLVAVVSTGPLCPHAGADFAARTDQLADWISATMAEPPSGTSWWLAGSLGGGVLGLVVLAFAILRRNRRRGPRGGAHLPPAAGRRRERELAARF